jgi:serine phosphatase RsbU (regulator of sigma subunit)
MSSTLSSCRVLYDACEDPARLVTGVSELLYRTTEGSRFVTLFVGFLEPASGRLVYCSAGHNPPLVIGPGEPRELAATGIPAGMMSGFPYTSSEVRLECGEMLALYTDGIPEAMHGEEFFSDERLVAALREHAATPDLETVSKSVLERVYEFQAGEARSDDITLVLLRREPA